MQVTHRVAALTLLCSQIGCGRPATPVAEPMEVVRVFPAHSEPEVAARIVLNQEIQVFFSRPLDPLSVHADTVRMLDAAGNRVRGRLRVGSQSVTFEPIPPVRPSLDDGSFAPDREYRLEIAGLPLWNALRSQTGQRLDETFRARFRTVSLDATDGLSTPFVPVGPLSSEPLAMVDDIELRMASDTGKLLVQFNAPLLPPSVTPDAFSVLTLVEGQAVPVQPLAARILPDQRAPMLPFGSTVELQLPSDQIDPNGFYYLSLADAQSGRTVRDYLGRPVEGGRIARRISIEPGDRVRLTQLGGREPWRIESSVAADLPAPAGLPMVAREGRLTALCHVEAGGGMLGAFAPTRSMVLRPGEAFDRGDGQFVVGRDGQFDFASIEIPRGVVVRIESLRPVMLRSMGEVRVDGTLELATPLVEPRFKSGNLVELSTLGRESGCSLIAGGDVVVLGSIDHVRGSEPGSPCTLVVGGTLVARGRLPTELVISAPQIVGAIESMIRLAEVGLRPGVPPAADTVASAFSEWLPLGLGRPEQVDVALGGIVGELEVRMHLAPAHSVDASRPDPEHHRVRSVLIDGSSIELAPAEQFVRFEFRARLGGGRSLPSIASVRVLAGRG